MKFQFNGLPAGRLSGWWLKFAAVTNSQWFMGRRMKQIYILRATICFYYLLERFLFSEKGSYILQKCIDLCEMSHVSLDYFKGNISNYRVLKIILDETTVTLIVYCHLVETSSVLPQCHFTLCCVAKGMTHNFKLNSF